MPTFTAAIKGSNFRPRVAREVVKDLTPHEAVEIEPEPDNPYDPNALRIIARNEFIGYVQKGIAAYLAARITEGTTAYVSEERDPTGLYFIEITVP